MKVEYKHNVDNTYLIMEEAGTYREDYQMKMLRANPIPGLIEINGSGIDEASRYYYNICGKVSMKAMYAKAKIGNEDLVSFMQQLIGALKSVHAYMLKADSVLLSPEYIFYEEGNFFFCYYPPQKQEICKEFHKLSEYLVSQVDYADKEGIYVAYELHKSTMEDNYSIEQVMNRIMGNKDQIVKEVYEEQEKSLVTENDGEDYTDKGIAKRRGSQTKRPFLKKIRPKKRHKWGEWDDLQMEDGEI